MPFCFMSSRCPRRRVPDAPRMIMHCANGDLPILLERMRHYAGRIMPLWIGHTCAPVSAYEGVLAFGGQAGVHQTIHWTRIYHGYAYWTACLAWTLHYPTHGFVSWPAWKKSSACIAFLCGSGKRLGTTDWSVMIDEAEVFGLFAPQRRRTHVTGYPVIMQCREDTALRVLLPWLPASGGLSFAHCSCLWTSLAQPSRPSHPAHARTNFIFVQPGISH
jgi:hypothetical protein